jgi:DNA-binding IclR family transcriptional regulator
VAGGAREPGRTVTSRVLAILGAFDASHQRLTLSDLARRTDLPLSTVHRLVAELEEWRAVTRDPAGGYRVGLRLWELGQLAPGRLRDVAHPWLQELFDSTRENVHLAVRDGVEVLYVDKVYGRRAVPIVSRVGGRLPMHPTGVGKVLLAHRPDWFVRSYLERELERPTRFTITEPGRLGRELAEVRRRGWAVTCEEMTLGSCSLAAPVLDGDGQVAGALGIVLSSRRCAELPRLVTPLRRTAAQIEQALREDVQRAVAS